MVKIDLIQCGFISCGKPEGTCWAGIGRLLGISKVLNFNKTKGYGIKLVSGGRFDGKYPRETKLDSLRVVVVCKKESMKNEIISGPNC